MESSFMESSAHQFARQSAHPFAQDAAHPKRIIVTSALPYANGSIHIGHLVEYIQTDILVRAWKMMGKDVVYCCADDTHGAPIDIKAQQLCITPEQLIAQSYIEHTRDFSDFHIEFDSYYTTNSPENKHIASQIFLKLQERGFIYQKDMELTYCVHDKRFLPDRYVKGECPKCHAKDQYGDVCESCDTAYKTVDLINPYCVLCKNPPERRISNHYFFKLSAFSDRLKEWLTNNKELQPEIRNQILNWITNGLEDWCISRDGPYFGFKIPGEQDKYFYVWLDAPIGYISSFAHFLKKDPEHALAQWNGSQIVHVIGKDIIYFHLLFWPAVLMGADIKLPQNVLVHGFLKVNNEKMSKSRGTFLTAQEFLDILPNKNPELLHYYYAANLGRNMTDINLDLTDFKEKINNELVSNIANFIYRTLSFIGKHFENKVPILPANRSILNEASTLSRRIIVSYDSYEFRNAVKDLLSLSSLANKYFQDSQPWALVKTDKAAAGEVLALAANLVKRIVILLKPILPATAEEFEKQLNLHGLMFSDLDVLLENHALGQAAIILQRIEEMKLGKDISKPLQEKKEPKQQEKKKELTEEDLIRILSRKSKSEEKNNKEMSEETHGDFTLLDIRVAKIIEVKRHPGAEKLYIEKIDLGNEQREIVSGLVPYYAEDELLGKHILVVANLQPAKLRGVLSQGMLLAAQEGNVVGLLLAPHAVPGTRVHLEGSPATHGHHTPEQITYEQFSRVRMAVHDGLPSCEGRKLVAEGSPVTVERVKMGPIR